MEALDIDLVPGPSWGPLHLENNTCTLFADVQSNEKHGEINANDQFVDLTDLILLFVH